MKLPCPIRPPPRKTCRLVLGVVVVVVNDRHHVGTETSGLLSTKGTEFSGWMVTCSSQCGRVPLAYWFAGLLVCFSWEEKYMTAWGAACCIMRFCLSAWPFLFLFFAVLTHAGCRCWCVLTAHPWDGHVVDATIYLKHAGLSWFSLVVPALPSVSLFGMRVCGMMSCG